MGRKAISSKLLYVVSHPIQYQAPLLRRISDCDDIELRVMFERRPSDDGFFDSGFGKKISWDIPLTTGYDHIAFDSSDIACEVARADFVWLHGWQTPIIRSVLRHANLAGVPVLMRSENCEVAMPDGRNLRGWLKRTYIRQIFDACDVFLAIGSANRRYYLNRGVNPDTIFSMPYAIDNEAFCSSRDDKYPIFSNLTKQLAETPNFDTRRPVVLVANKLIARKRTDLIIRALAQSWCPETRPNLIIVGDGHQRAELEAQAPWAIFTGFVNQSELPAYYKLADVFVLPSECEPWGLAVNEAMAAATPVIVSTQVGCAEDLVDENTGMIFESGNATNLATAVAACLKDCTKMGIAAAAKINKWSFSEDIEGLRQALASFR